ncbi:MAG: metallophosphoesterase [Intrasporangium sp.]|uniref:metallophosphoesterase n=1 Tax=Intrasporangium sp. TaxID=1925024 RepID=UPI003F7FD693
MSVFVVVVAAVLAALTYLLYRRLAVAPRWPTGVRRSIGGVLGVGWVAVLGGFAVQGGELDPARFRWLAWLGMTWVAVSWYLLLGACLLGIACLVTRLLRRDRRPVLRAGSVAVGLLAVGTTAYGLGEAAMPAVTPVTVASADLPAAATGTRIALVTDLHVGPVRDATFTRRVVEAVNAAKPDLVVLGGDLADGRVAQVGAALAPLADLDAPLGVVAVSGNHEYLSGEPDQWLALWERLGITVLRNSNVAVAQRGAHLTVAGMTDPQGGPFGAAPDAAAALAGAAADGFTLLVAHQPRQAFDVQGKGVDLQLSGHTHGGQLWPFTYLVRLQQPMISGRAMIGDVPVLTSRGAGAWGPPVRVLAPPEIPLITLNTV